ncbi:MAG TPA: flagellar basal body-associated FliL family protein [Pirellulales bacterium]|nr:flagellar basal body-associated FliL family protein [Pirellulales bacterium]
MSATTAAPTAAPAEAAPAGQKSGWFWKVVVLGLIMAVIGAECLFAFVYVTMATDKSNHTETATAPAKPAKHEGGHEPAAAKEHGKHGEHGQHGEASIMGEELETDMGEYSLTAFQPASSTTLLINFHLYGTIASEQEPYFTASYDTNKHRIRDQVLTTIRSAELADLTDPGLDLIKRQILEKTNRALGKPILQGIVFSDFVAVEQ